MLAGWWTPGIECQGPEGHWNVAGIRVGPCPPPAQAQAAKFGSVLSSVPYLVLQVIRLRHKGGRGPLWAARLPRSEDGECRAGD